MATVQGYKNCLMELPHFLIIHIEKLVLHSGQGYRDYEVSVLTEQLRRISRNLSQSMRQNTYVTENIMNQVVPFFYRFDWRLFYKTKPMN